MVSADPVDLLPRAAVVRNAVLMCLIAVGSLSAEGPPERLLPSGTQVYYRWDGIAAHRGTYDRTARSAVYAGPLGKSIDRIYDHFVDFAARELIDHARAGDKADVRIKRLKKAADLPNLIAQKGLVVGFEMTPPQLRLDALGKMIGLTAPDKGKPPGDMIQVDMQLTVIIPNAADRPEVAAVFEELPVADPRFERATVRGRETLFRSGEEFNVGCWREAGHFVLVVGNLPIKRSVEKTVDAGDGIVGRALFQRLGRKQEFTVVSRAFVDFDSLYRAFRSTAVLSSDLRRVPLLEASGLSGIKSILMNEGFDGAESRSSLEIETVADRRTGVAAMMRPEQFSLSAMPAIPPDAVRWSWMGLDLRTVFQLWSSWMVIDSAPERMKNARAVANDRALLEQELQTALGFHPTEFFDALSGPVVMYESPTDGRTGIGHTMAVRIRDAKAMAAIATKLSGKLPKLTGGDLTARPRTVSGVETTEFSVPGLPLQPTTALCGDWWVIGPSPAAVRGFILRSQGKLPIWKPDDRSAGVLKAIGEGTSFVQWADPSSTVRTVLGSAGSLNSLIAGRFKDWDAGELPHPDEVTRHLFPNVSWIRHDGHTLRLQSRQSLAVPLEMIGWDWLPIATRTWSAGR